MPDDFSLDKIPMVCPHCHKNFPAGAKFCNTCGGALEFDFSRLDLGDAAAAPASTTPVSDQTRVYHIDTEKDAPGRAQPIGQTPVAQTPPMPRFDPETGLPLGQPAPGYAPPQRYPDPPVAAPQKKSRTGLIVGIVAAVVIVAALAIVLVTTKCFGLLGGDPEDAGDVSPEDALAEAQTAYDDGSYAKAVALLEAAIADGKTDDPAYYALLGQSYEAQNNHRAAAEAYESGYRATNDNGLKADAIRLYKLAQNWQKVAALDPDDPDAQAALQAQENVEDEPSDTPSEPAEPEPELTPLEQAQAAYDDGDYETASEIAQEIVEDDPSVVAAWNILGGSALNLGDVEAASDYYGDGYRATDDEELMGSYIQTLYTLAQVAREAEDDEAALSYYQQILEIVPDEMVAASGAQEIIQAHTIHTYEVVAGDVTWTNAKSLAEAAGGHLATIADAEEFRQITTLANEQGLHVLWLGAQAERLEDWSSDDFTWLTGEPFDWANWLEGEPNCDLDEEFYLGAYDIQGTWYFNDCPNDVSQYYSGKIGYVIEYEELDF